MLTMQQHNTFEFIKNFIKKYKISPTMAEIAKGIGIKSRGVVHRYVHAIADEGLIKTIPKRSRNIQLLDLIPGFNLLPLVGAIAAGQPIEAIEDNETINIGEIFLGEGRFALRVKGDSMIEDGIFDGDVVVCQRSEVANDGQIVVALIDNSEATLKRIQKNTNQTITLLPANAKLKPMVYDANRVTIQGIFIGLLRMAN